jgi:hypothetical protein
MVNYNTGSRHALRKIDITRNACWYPAFVTGRSADT